VDYLLETDSLNRAQMLFKCAVNNILNNIILSLQVKRGSFFLLPEFGSRLHEITDTSDSSIALAQAYGTEALAWLTRVGRVKTVDASASRITSGISLEISVVELNGELLQYTHYHRIA
jgi:phage gp46-like protein